MIILGIDPGSKNCGFGVLELEKRRIIAAGCDDIRVSRSISLPQKILYIYNEIKKIIKEYKPDMAAVESIFYGKNIKSAFTLGHVRGAILLALAESEVEIFEYSPREIKKAVVGNGNASKEQVQFMVKKIVNLNLDDKSQDATDGLAGALCLYNKIKFKLK